MEKRNKGQTIIYKMLHREKWRLYKANLFQTCSTSGICHVTFAINLVISHEWGENGIALNEKWNISVIICYTDITWGELYFCFKYDAKFANKTKII